MHKIKIGTNKLRGGEIIETPSNHADGRCHGEKEKLGSGSMPTNDKDV
jgi:hypothetical protein